MNAKQVREALELAEMATPEPWIWNFDSTLTLAHGQIRIEGEQCPGLESDGRFIALARTGWPETLKQLDEAMLINRKQHDAHCYICRFTAVGEAPPFCAVKEFLRAYFEEQANA